MEADTPPDSCSAMRHEKSSAHWRDRVGMRRATGYAFATAIFAFIR